MRCALAKPLSLPMLLSLLPHLFPAFYGYCCSRFCASPPSNALEAAANLSTNSTLSPASEAHESAVRSTSSPAPSSSGGVSSQAASHPRDSDFQWEFVVWLSPHSCAITNSFAQVVQTVVFFDSNREWGDGISKGRRWRMPRDNRAELKGTMVDGRR